MASPCTTALPRPAGPVFHAVLRALVANSSGFQLLPAHMLWEIRPLGTDKGRAVEALMARAPFSGPPAGVHR